MVCTKKGRVNWGRIAVVPLAGTWIETPLPGAFPFGTWVVPLAGTWIETKYDDVILHFGVVVPLAGTWIETLQPN